MPNYLWAYDWVTTNNRSRCWGFDFVNGTSRNNPMTNNFSGPGFAVVKIALFVVGAIGLVVSVLVVISNS